MYLRRKRKFHWQGRNYSFDLENKKTPTLPFLLIALALILSVVLIWFLIARSGTALDSEKKTESSDDKPLSGFPPLAKVEKTGLTVFLPCEASKVVTIGYHEAENPRTLSLQPMGYCVGNDNPKKMDMALPILKGKTPFFILNNRGRRTSATSAVDITVKPGSEIASPVSGQITKIKRYFLYGKYEDFHIEIMPEGYPDLRIAMIHLDNLRIKVGDKVKQGDTVLANIRMLAQINSQIDRYTGNNFGHTHIQVNPFVPEDKIPGT